MRFCSTQEEWSNHVVKLDDLGLIEVFVLFLEFLDIETLVEEMQEIEKLALVVLQRGTSHEDLEGRL